MFLLFCEGEDYFRVFLARIQNNLKIKTEKKTIRFEIDIKDVWNFNFFFQYLTICLFQSSFVIVVNFVTEKKKEANRSTAKM